MPTLALRPALATLAGAPATTTVRKLWKALTPDERALGITTALDDDENGWVKNTARAAVAGALRFRPQTVATWSRPKLVSEAARLPLDDVQLISAFLVDLHLGHRRPMMAAFLDSLGIPNDEGRIDSEKVEVPPQDDAKLRTAANDLAARYPADEVVTYFLTLLLQDSAVWKGLVEWMEETVTG
jgi:hypothetical protein